jgi:hypothetical protein
MKKWLANERKQMNKVVLSKVIICTFLVSFRQQCMRLNAAA